MKNIIFLLSFIISSSIYPQTYNLTKDIEDKYLEKIVVDNDDSLMIQYRNFAIDLFLNGTKVNDSIWKNIDKNLVGVCLHAEDDTLGKRKIDFNLYSLNYRDDRIEDFHERIYFGEGSEKISNFFVTCNNESEVDMLNSAINFYLRKDSIPKTNGAYSFSKNHMISIDNYGKIFPSDNISTIAMDHTYSYIRQNGNFLIQIQSIPQNELKAGTDKIYETDYFTNNWAIICVFIIDESDGRAYKVIF